MSELRIESRILSAADLGPDNPLPDLAAGADTHAGTGAERDASFGRVNGCLPYRVQDGYNRNQRPRAFTMAVLENETLRAEFFIEAGGRMRSLYHKRADRELLHVNPVFQPANLAIRNAWISGGVEWNCGIIGHSPFTCAPVFAARAAMDDGTPVLRMWEWERIRQAVYQIDVFLPDGSPVLYVRVRISNPLDRGIAMYWWSNIAVNEQPGLRVIVPANSAAHFGYRDGLKDTPVPIHDGVDVTYPVHLNRAQDFFYNIDGQERKFIAALDAGGRGLVQTSTDRLLGRKLFVWGQGTGGRRWQAYLAQPGCAYIEIQAGLARTQMDYLPMPARTDWSWLEAYGLADADPRRMHGDDWAAARASVESCLDRLVSRDQLEALHRASAAMAGRPPLEILHRGSGWGALERLRRRRFGEPPFPCPGIVFDDASLSAEQAPWRTLLDTGRLPEGPPDQPPGAFLVQPEWRTLLETALAAGNGRHWLSLWQAGLMRHAAGQRDAARQAWIASFRATPNVWALRNLAALALADGQIAAATGFYRDACRRAPGLTPLAVETGRALLKTGQPRVWLDLVDTLAADVRDEPRVRLLRAWACLHTGDLDAVEAFLAGDTVVADIREGEVALSDLWFDLQARRRAAAEGVPLDEALRQRVRRDCPPPDHLDFRMNA